MVVNLMLYSISLKASTVKYYCLILILLTCSCTSSGRIENVAGSLNERPFFSQNGQVFFRLLKGSPAKAVDKEGNVISSKQLSIVRVWDQDLCRTTVKNVGQHSVFPSNIILFQMTKHGLPPDSPVYGEGFQMLHQNGGTLAIHQDIGIYADNRHYKNS